MISLTRLTILEIHVALVNTEPKMPPTTPRINEKIAKPKADLIRSSSFHPFKGKYFEKAVECPETFVDQEKCEYCGGIYVVGMSDVCPNCAAPIKPKEKI